MTTVNPLATPVSAVVGTRRLPRRLENSRLPLPENLTAVRPRDWIPIWRRVIEKPSVKAVGYAAATFATFETGEDIYPGAERLARICGEGVAPRTVRVALARIRELGLMHRYIEGSMHGQRRISDHYQLTFPDDLYARVRLLEPDDHVISDHRISHHVISDPRPPDLTSPITGRQITQPTQVPTHLPPHNVGSVADGAVEGSGRGHIKIIDGGG